MSHGGDPCCLWAWPVLPERCHKRKQHLGSSAGTPSPAEGSSSCSAPDRNEHKAHAPHPWPWDAGGKAGRRAFARGVPYCTSCWRCSHHPPPHAMGKKKLKFNFQSWRFFGKKTSQPATVKSCSFKGKITKSASKTFVSSSGSSSKAILFQAPPMLIMSVEWVFSLHTLPYNFFFFLHELVLLTEISSYVLAAQLWDCSWTSTIPGHLLGCLFGVNCWCSSHCINLPTAFSASICICGLGRVHSSWWDAIHGEWGVVGKWLMTSMFAAQHTQTGTKIPGWCVCCTANTESRVMNTFAQFWLTLTKLFYASLEMMSIYIFFFASRIKLKMHIVVINTFTFWRCIFIQLLLCKIHLPDSSIKAVAVCSSPHSTLPALTSLNASSPSPQQGWKHSNLILSSEHSVWYWMQLNTLYPVWDTFSSDIFHIHPSKTAYEV